MSQNLESILNHHKFLMKNSYNSLELLLHHVSDNKKSKNEEIYETNNEKLIQLIENRIKEDTKELKYCIDANLEKWYNVYNSIDNANNYCSLEKHNKNDDDNYLKIPIDINSILEKQSQECKKYVPQYPDYLVKKYLPKHLANVGPCAR